MKWEGNRESDNVEDARGSGGGGGFRLGGRGIGLGSVAVALVAGWIFGINPLTILGLMGGGEMSPQTKSHGTVMPESFTHGSSAQRVTWFKRGLQTGSMAQCNTFEARQL